MLSDAGTKNCVRCNKLAKIYAGHVIVEKGAISGYEYDTMFAGWCTHECLSIKHPNYKGIMGCFGEYKSEYGIIDDVFKQECD